MTYNVSSETLSSTLLVLQRQCTVGSVVLRQSIGHVIEKAQVQLSPNPLQATSCKLLTYCVLMPTQPPTLSGMGNVAGYMVCAACMG